MRIDIMTLFPDAIEAMMGQSIIGRARDRGFIRLYTHQIGSIPPISRCRWTITPTAAVGER